MCWLLQSPPSMLICHNLGIDPVLQDTHTHTMFSHTNIILLIQTSHYISLYSHGCLHSKNGCFYSHPFPWLFEAWGISWMQASLVADGEGKHGKPMFLSSSPPGMGDIPKNQDAAKKLWLQVGIPKKPGESWGNCGEVPGEG